MAGDLRDSFLVSYVHGELDTIREGAEVVPAVLCPRHKQPQRRKELGQRKNSQAVVLRLSHTIKNEREREMIIFLIIIMMHVVCLN